MNKNIKLSQSLLPAVVVFGGLYICRHSLWDFMKIKVGQFACWIQQQAETCRREKRPDMIIILRHGQSAANINDQIYAQLPDNQIPLTELGRTQASQIGAKLKDLIGDDKEVIFYVSSFNRAQETAKEILNFFPESSQYYTDPRIREQEWGNLQKFQKHPEKCQQVFFERNLVGRFYFRFETGESAADVYDRVGMFIDSLFHEADHSSSSTSGKRKVYIIVAHGMVMRLFMMRYFRKSVDEFDQMPNPKNCEAWILKKNKCGDGSFKYDSKISLEQQTE